MEHLLHPSHVLVPECSPGASKHLSQHTHIHTHRWDALTGNPSRHYLCYSCQRALLPVYGTRTRYYLCRQDKPKRLTLSQHELTDGKTEKTNTTWAAEPGCAPRARAADAASSTGYGPEGGGSGLCGRESPGPGRRAPFRPARPRAPPQLAPGPGPPHAAPPPSSPVLGRGPPLVEQAEQRAGGGRAADDGGMAHGEVLAVGSHGASAAAEPQPSPAVPRGRRECRDEGRGTPGLASAGRREIVCLSVYAVSAVPGLAWGGGRRRLVQRGLLEGGGQRSLPSSRSGSAPAPLHEQWIKGDGRAGASEGQWGRPVPGSRLLPAASRPGGSCLCARGSLCSCTPSVSPQCHTWVKAARNKPFRKTFTSVLPYCLSFRALRGAAKLNFQHRGTCS